MGISKETPVLPNVGEIIHLDSPMGSRFIVASRHEGGMGVVFRLSQMNPLLPDLAFKLLATGTDFTMAEREARVWISIGTGPSIAKAHWGGFWRGRPAILADWYTGDSSKLRPEHWLTHDFLAFARELTLGLKYALDVGGIIHRDIKPSNILIDDNFKPYVTDFGIAILAGSPVDDLGSIREVIFESNRTVVCHNASGTPPFMAPEIFTGAKASVVTDIYSLGVTLFHLLTGEHPYAGPETNWRFNPQLRTAPFERGLKRLGNRSETTARLIASCLQLNPSSRIPSYENLLALLPKGMPSPAPNSASSSTRSDYVDAAAAVNLATTHRNQGNPKLAEHVLQEAVKRLPDDPLILNAWGAQAARSQNQKEAVGAWLTASRSLERSDGLYSGSVYLDPVVNLSRHFILNFEYKSAAEWLVKAREWANRHNSRPLHMFPEFGWLALYEGAVQDAAAPLRLHLANTHADGVAAAWLALSCALGNHSVDAELQVCRSFLAIDDWSPTTTIAALVMATMGKSPESNDLRKVAVQAFMKCKTTEGIPLPQAMQMTDLSVSSLKIIFRELVRMLDSVVTGGKNREMA